MIRHRIAHNFAGKNVHLYGEKKLALIGRQVCQLSRPNFVGTSRPRCRLFDLKYPGSNGELMIGVGSFYSVPFLRNARNPSLGHQAGNPNF